jgi:hypothetical protein
MPKSGHERDRLARGAPVALGYFDLDWLPSRLRDSREVRDFVRAVDEVRDLLRREQTLELPDRVLLVPPSGGTRAGGGGAVRLRGTDPAELAEAAPLEPTAEDETAVGRILADPGMLPADVFAAELGITRQTVSEMRRRGEVLALPKDRRNWRYPKAQLGDGGVLPGIDRVVAALGQGWQAWRFLATRHGGLGSHTGFEALRAGRIEDLLRLAPGFGTDFA